MRLLLVCLASFTFACAGNDGAVDQNPIGGDIDAGIPTPGVDAGASGTTDGGMSMGSKPAGAACTTGAECAGGTCLGAPGQPQEGNNRFAGGYCTAIGCTPDSQDGCGPDEYCVESGDSERGGYCVELCSKADGLVCDRPDHVCLGLGSFGGCYSQETVECTVKSTTDCAPEEICVRIGYEDKTIGRCETRCDPLDDEVCTDGHSCYYIRTYNASFCGITGTSQPEEPCSCDKCCVDGYACTPDEDGTGRHCKKYCDVANPTQCGAGEHCTPIEDNRPEKDYVSPVGGCIAPGSAGTPK